MFKAENMNKLYPITIAFTLIFTSCGRMPARVQTTSTTGYSTSAKRTPIQMLRQGVIYYPYLALREKIEGKVYAKVYIDEKGLPRQVIIARREVNKKFILNSSGEWQDTTNIFDQATIQSLEESMWRPAFEEGKPKSSWVMIPFVYKIDSNQGAVEIHDFE